jgi:uncharacterized protein YbaR (Trm112 family)
MNLLLTDLLDCPKCLAGIGLILLADRVDGRRVHEGQLGCPQCRTKYRVRDGVVDFIDSDPAAARASISVDALEIAALMGLTEGPATVLLLGGLERAADEIARMLQDVQVVVAHAGATHSSEHDAVSVLRANGIIPLRNGSVRAVVIGGDGVGLKEAMRVCGLAGRIIVQGPDDEVIGAVQQSGFRILAKDPQRVVAVRVV